MHKQIYLQHNYLDIVNRGLLVRILAEDVPNDNNGLLDDIVDLGLNEVQQGANAALSRLLWVDTLIRTGD